MKDELLPQALCNSCYDLLYKLSDFKRTCLQSHKTLMNHNIKSENEKMTFDDVLAPENYAKIKDWSFKSNENYISETQDIQNHNAEVKDEYYEDSYNNGKNPVGIPYLIQELLNT